MGLLQVTVDNLAREPAADQQAERPRAKWIGTLSIRLRTPTGGPGLSSVRATWAAPSFAADRASRGLLVGEISDGTFTVGMSIFSSRQEGL